MKKLIISGLVLVSVSLFALHSVYSFRTEGFISGDSIVFKSEIRPAFNPKVENYYLSNCEDNKLQIEIDRNLNYEIENSVPITKVSIKYFNLFKKNYYFTCIEPRVSNFDLTIAESYRTEYILTDELVIPNEANEQFSGTIALRDSLGTPIWWLSPNSTPIANLKLSFLRDPKLIDNGTKVLFVGSTSPALGTSLDGF